MKTAIQIARMWSGPITILGSLSTALIYAWIQSIQAKLDNGTINEEQSEGSLRLARILVVVTLVTACAGCALYIWVSGIPSNPVHK